MKSKRSTNRPTQPHNLRAEHKISGNDRIIMNGILVYGIHPVTHLLQDTTMHVQAVFIQEDLKSEEIDKIKTLADKKGLFPQVKQKKFLDQLAKNHQGIIAQVKEQSFYKPIDLLKSGRFVFILDHLEDPQNLGSILRTADQFGADGVVIPKNRSVGITSTVIKVSSGAALFVPLIQESSLLFVVEKLKEFGYWIYSTSVGAGKSISQTEFSGKVAIILGNESNGVSEQLIKKSDFLVNIPSYKKKKVDSLNVSVAAGILAYEISKNKS